MNKLLIFSLQIFLLFSNYSYGKSVKKVLNPTIESHGDTFFLKKVKGLKEYMDGELVGTGTTNITINGKYEVIYSTEETDETTISNYKRLGYKFPDEDIRIIKDKNGNIIKQVEKTYDENNFLKSVTIKMPNKEDDVEVFKKIVNKKQQVILQSNKKKKLEYIFNDNGNLIKLIGYNFPHGDTLKLYDEVGNILLMKYGYSLNIEYSYSGNMFIGKDTDSGDEYKAIYNIKNGKLIELYNYNRAKDSEFSLTSKIVYEY